MSNAETGEAGQLLTDLCKVSHLYGADDEFVIAGGGNTSVKTSDRMWVKASGTELGTITAEGFVQLDRAQLTALLAATLPEETSAREEAYKNAVLAARIEPERGQRASVEALMHHAIPPTFVVHTHSTVMNQLTCCVKGEALARELYGTAILWIPFVDPGFILSREISAQMQAYAQAHDGALPRAILMQNHGIILAGESIEAIQAETQALLAPLVARMAELPPTAEAPEARGAEPIVGEIEATLLALAAEAGGTPHVRFNESAPVRRFVGDAEGSSLAAQGPLTPDQIVYCKSFPLWIDPAAGDLRAAWAAHIEQYGYAPKVVLAKGLGLFAVGDSERASGIVSRVYADAIKIMLGARRLGGVRFMTPRDREFIDNWEVEAYRRNVSAKQMS